MIPANTLTSVCRSYNGLVMCLQLHTEHAAWLSWIITENNYGDFISNIIYLIQFFSTKTNKQTKKCVTSFTILDVDSTAPIHIFNHVFFIIAGQFQQKALQKLAWIAAYPLTIKILDRTVGFRSPASSLVRAVKGKVFKSVQHFHGVTIEVGVFVVDVLMDKRKL